MTARQYLHLAWLLAQELKNENSDQRMLIQLTIFLGECIQRAMKLMYEVDPAVDDLPF